MSEQLEEETKKSFNTVCEVLVAAFGGDANFASENGNLYKYLQ